MPPQLQAAKERSLAAEKAKEAIEQEPPAVRLVGLRKTPVGYEVVQLKLPIGATLTVINPAEPLEYASQSLLLAIRQLVATV